MTDRPHPAERAMIRAELARASGLAQAIAQARPYPPNMDGVRDVAAEIATLIDAFLAVPSDPRAYEEPSSDDGMDWLADDSPWGKITVVPKSRLIEATAKGLWAYFADTEAAEAGEPVWKAWDGIEEATRAEYRAKARAALEAARKVRSGG